MKQSLQLRLGQHLTMTPQLQQAIRLLQLSTLELQAEVQQALESNPLLELAEENEQVPGEGANPDTGEAANEPLNGQDLAEPAAREVDAAAGAGEDERAMEMAVAIPQALPVVFCWVVVFVLCGVFGCVGSVLVLRG